MREKYKIPWQYIIGELEWDEKNIFTEKNENQEKEVNKIIKLHREETVQYEEGKKKKPHKTVRTKALSCERVWWSQGTKKPSYLEHDVRSGV